MPFRFLRVSATNIRNCTMRMSNAGSKHWFDRFFFFFLKIFNNRARFSQQTSQQTNKQKQSKKMGLKKKKKEKQRVQSMRCRISSQGVKTKCTLCTRSRTNRTIGSKLSTMNGRCVCVCVWVGGTVQKVTMASTGGGTLPVQNRRVLQTSAGCSRDVTTP